jgi:hypothetical protein
MNKEGVNIYERNKLYEEVWASPVTHVAKTYGVSDVAIRKICKSMNIPTPPSGYWAKLQYGKEIHKIPLPPAKEGQGIRRGIDPSKREVKTTLKNGDLSFLNEIELEALYNVIYSININPSENFCREINAHKKAVDAWNKKYESILGHNYSYSEFKSKRSYVNREYVEVPVLAGVVSDDSLLRIYTIINCINNALSEFGYHINADLSFTIRGERVEFIFFERQESFKHILTTKEEKALMQYENHLKRHGYGLEPYIPSKDYRFNGQLVFTTKKSYYIKDTDELKIEDRISDMVIQLLQQSEIVRLERIEREEAQRKREEEERRRKLYIETYNNEVDKLSILLKEADDFAIATKIRDYIYDVQQKDFQHKKAAWIKWAKEKADWYDPSVSSSDTIFGQREYGDLPVPDKKGNRYYWQ